MTYDSIATLSQVISLLMFLAMFLAVVGMHCGLATSPALRRRNAGRSISMLKAWPTGGADDSPEAGR